MIPEGELLLDRAFLVDLFLSLRDIFRGGSRTSTEVAERLKKSLPTGCPEIKWKAGLVIFEELGILSRYSRGGQEYFQYHAVKKKMDLNASPTFCRYRK